MVCLFQEYERAAAADGRLILNAKDQGDASGQGRVRESIFTVINPNNPTGMFYPIEDLRRLIENHASDKSFVLVDESMLPWFGPKWRTQSLLSIPEWIVSQWETRKVSSFFFLLPSFFIYSFLFFFSLLFSLFLFFLSFLFFFSFL